MTTELKRPETFAERVQAVMETTTISRTMHPNDLARSTGINNKRVRNILKGSEPTISEATAIARDINVPVEYLISGEISNDDKELTEPCKGCGCEAGEYCEVCDDDESDGSDDQSLISGQEEAGD